MVPLGESFYDNSNEHGFMQSFRRGAAGDVPVCSKPECRTEYVNRGAGMVCPTCKGKHSATLSPSMTMLL